MRNAGIPLTLKDISPLILLYKVEDIKTALATLESFPPETHPLDVLDKVLSLCLEAGDEFSSFSTALYERILLQNKGFPSEKTIGLFLERTKSLPDLESIYADIVRFNMLRRRTVQLALLRCMKQLAAEKEKKKWFPAFNDFVRRLQNQARLKRSSLLYILRAYVEAGEVELAVAFLEKNRDSFRSIPYRMLFMAIKNHRWSEKTIETNVVWRLLNDMARHTTSMRPTYVRNEVCWLIQCFAHVGDVRGLRYLLEVGQGLSTSSSAAKIPITIPTAHIEMLKPYLSCENPAVLRAFISSFASPSINEPRMSSDLLLTYGPSCDLVEDDVLCLLQSPKASISLVAQIAIQLGITLSESKAYRHLAISRKLPKLTSASEDFVEDHVVRKLVKALVVEVNEVLGGDDILHQLSLLSTVASPKIENQ
ncbi:hypothetical protein HDU67_007068 [Dinochytrium kinnereticum]|nr:hypothetical protein HDU67_007068 [Dinochytrium kinnereticum]